MTSMLLTASNAAVRPPPIPSPASGRGWGWANKTSARLRAGVGWQVLFLRVLLGRFDHHRPYHLLVGVDPVGDESPFLPIPLVHFGAGNASVVLACHLERRQQTLEAELVELVRGEVEVLQTPAYLLAGQWLVAELRLSGAHRFRGEQRIDHAAVVEDAADIL